MRVRTVSRVRFGMLTIASLSMLVSGCALSPGMSFSGVGSAVSAAPRASGGERPGESPLSSADIPSHGQLVEITGDLVAKERAARPTGIPSDVEKLLAKAGPYTIGPGDVLTIVVWDHPELNLPGSGGLSGGPDATGANSIAPGYTVDTNGFIQYAYIGPVKVEGLSEMGVRNVLTKRLSRYVRQPQITVRVQTYRSKRIYLDGEVKNPGVEVLNDMAMTLPEAINRAGGFTERSDRSRVAITRGDDTVFVDIPDMIRKGVNPDRIVLRNGDLVRVYPQSDSKVYVLGEVGHPGGLTFNNGRMTLNEALGSAGGISQTSGDASQVYVVRRSVPGKSEIFHLDASSPTAMATADAFELKPNDVVFVDASALVKWSRVIGLIVPSTQAAAAGRAAGY